MKISDLKIPFLLVAALSLIALLPMPYGYYVFLRIAVTGVGGFTAYLRYISDEKDWILWSCVAVAILFNPFLPIHLTKEIWMVFNVLTAALFSYFYWKDLS
ncbi:MAG: hypothetical protein GW748_05165 [Alphaproteobacteria bacterium]|nr:hypothetical protein [Alphaproteobacteria bacterium]NCQ67116.1 hypothetical protein [Alphaproteobacteria bacterium]NCT07713.1 hypothetical protein [Alphaproteobacteria bacterium]